MIPFHFPAFCSLLPLTEEEEEQEEEEEEEGVKA